MITRVLGRVLVLAALLGGPLSAFAAVPTWYTNDNFFQSEQDAPVSFTQTAPGTFTGFTTTGKIFYQMPVVADMHVHLHRFSIDSAYFYISSFGVISAPSDTVALSIYLARAGWEEVV